MLGADDALRWIEEQIASETHNLVQQEEYLERVRQRIAKLKEVREFLNTIPGDKHDR